MKSIKIILAILYIISPIDLIPESILGFFGLLDDGAALLYLITTFFTLEENEKPKKKEKEKTPITNKNFNVTDSNLNENSEVRSNKSLYVIIIILIIVILILGGFFIYKEFGNKNEYQEFYTKNTTSYSQSQQEETKESKVENNNINQYIPTVEDARYINYNTYYNDYYDYSIDYPDDDYFQISKTYEDGMRLQNSNGEIIISLTSNWNPNGESLQQAYDKAVREKLNAPYKFLGKTFFTITYEENGILIFRKTMYDKSTNKYVYLYVSFPPEYKDYMTPIVERMANSMKKS
jgi:MORN repeat protein